MGIAFARHLQRALQDIDDRPGFTSARKVTITLELTPKIVDDGTVDTAIVAKVAGKIPDHASDPVVCQIRKKAGKPMAAFNDLSPNDPRQSTIDQLEE